MKTLVIQSSILGENSKSRQLVDHLLTRLTASEPDIDVNTRDLGATALPYFDGATLGGLFTPADQRTAEQTAAVAQADALIAELFDAQRIILAVPVYNFGLPAQLKTYIDHIARAGVTFKYGADGVPVGLLTGKEVFVVSARGGQAEGTPIDTVTPYLQTMLGFLGLNNITFIAGEGQAMGPDAAAAGIEKARNKIDALFALATPA